MRITSESVLCALDETRQYNDLAAVLLFGGDRGSCCETALVAREEDGSFLGATSLSLRGEDYSGTVELVGIYVAPSARKRGVARALVLEALNWFKDRGSTAPIRVYCLTPASIHLFESMGSSFEVQKSAGMPLHLQSLLLEADQSKKGGGDGR